MAEDFRLPAVIHGDPAQPPVIKHEAAGLYDVYRNTKTGRQTENRAGVLRDIRLVKGYTHDKGIALRRSSRNHAYSQWFRRWINDALTIYRQALQRERFRLYRLSTRLR